MRGFPIRADLSKQLWEAHYPQVVSQERFGNQVAHIICIKLTSVSENHSRYFVSDRWLKSWNRLVGRGAVAVAYPCSIKTI